MNFFRIRHFEQFQHYHNRRPPWIKLYRDLLHDPQFFALSEAERYQLIGLFIIASQCENKIPDNPGWIQHELMLSDPISLKRFIETEWVEMINTADIATSYQDASKSASTTRALAREEKRREENTLSAKNADDVRFLEKGQTNPSLPGIPTEEKTDRPRHIFEYTPDFEQVWSAYPNHGAKGAGFMAYQKAKKNGMPPLEKILEVIAKAKRSKQWTKQNGEFIPLLGTWINQHRWDDDYDPTSRPRGVVC